MDGQVVKTIGNLSIDSISSSGVFDVRGKEGAFPAEIQRISGHGTLVGPARTVRCADGSVSGVVSGIDAAQPGDVLVIQGAGDWAYLGELTGAEAIRQGVIGVVGDCYVRDVQTLSEWPIQVFARGLTPKGAGFKEPGVVGVPLRIGQITVNTGDWVVGDRDGVVVVPADEVMTVIELANELVSREGRWARGVLEGVSLMDQRFDDGTRLRDRLEGSL